MLPKGSVLALILFNIYTNDQSYVPDIRRFFHAEDLFIITVRLLRENRGDTLRRLVSSPTITDSGTLIPTPFIIITVAVRILTIMIIMTIAMSTTIK